MDDQAKGYGYGKRPLWQWILLYIVIGAIVYGLIYYFVFAKKGGYQYTAPAAVSPSASPSSASPSSATQSGALYATRTDPTKGTYMTDTKGMTLYTFDKDTTGVSNCYNACAKTWPPYLVSAQATLPASMTIITRTDGTKQYAWKGMPLYYFASDTKPGDLLGDGVGTVWHIVKM